MKIKVELIIEMDDTVWGTEASEIEWFNNEVMVADTLFLHSNVVGDEVGVVKEVVSWRFLDV